MEDLLSVVNGPWLLFMLFMLLIWYCVLFTLYLSVIYKAKQEIKFIQVQAQHPIDCTYFHTSALGYLWLCQVNTIIQ